MQKAKRTPSPRSSPREFALKCQCTVQRNYFPVKLNSKSKYFNLVLKPPRHLHIYPFSKQQLLMEFDVARIRNIQRRFIDQGKLTIEIYEGCEPLVIMALNATLNATKKEILTHIMIDNSLKQSLELFVERIGEMQRDIKRKSVCNLAVDRPAKQAPAKEGEKPTKKMASRRQMMKEAEEDQQRIAYEQLKKSERIRTKKVVELPKPAPVRQWETRLDQLPLEILHEIMQFVGDCHLRLRVLNRYFSEAVLRRVGSIRLQDEVDEATFKKLTKGALYVDCRMKNIRDIGHFTNLSEDGPITQSNSRWLNFSKWREMSAKNVDQLKGLRLFCLELPYSIKFQSQCLVGLKLVSLALKGTDKDVQQRNPYVTDANITMMVNLCPHLTMLEIAHVGQELLDNITTPQKMVALKIGTLELAKAPAVDSPPWHDFRRFTGLKQLAVRSCVDANQRVIGELAPNILMGFPVGLEKLTLGAFLNISTLLTQMPSGLIKLSLAGEHIRNWHLVEINLPKLKVLNIRRCPAITTEGLINCRGIRLKTRWEDYSIQGSLPFFFEQSITVVNEKPVMR